MPAVDAEMREHARLASELRQPQYLWFSALWQAMRALLEGSFEDTERLAGEALALGERVRTENPPGAYGGQLTFVRREQGRLAELVPWVQETMKQMPGQLVVRCGLASFYADLGQADDARREFEEVAAYGFAALPRDVYWLISLVHLADACAFLKDAPRAAALYELLAPFAGRNVVMGPGVACFGSAARLLGVLATTAERWAAAEEHFQAAIAFNARIGASAWLAHTQAQFAAMLIGRDAGGDRARAQGLLIDALRTAQRLGMKALVERVTALRLRAQGVSAVARSSIDAVVTFVQSERPDLRRYVAADGTVTIMFTDIEDFTVLTERLGDARAHAVVAAHNAIVRAAVASEGGVEVSVQGDGFMLVFRSARRALRSAVAIQRAIGAYAAEHPGAPIRVRVGIHTGEAIHEARELFGKAVIIAARIASQARGGEIVVSARVKELVEDSGDFRFGDGRAAALKGLAGTYEVFQVAW
jgi:class 3 adenylate cyclase